MTPHLGPAGGRPTRRGDGAGRRSGAGRPAAGDRRGPAPRPTTRRPPVPDPARRAVLDLLAAVRGGAFANLALPRLIDRHRLAGRDAALATELGYGTCRVLGQLDAVLDACSSRPLGEVDGVALDALRLGAYQLLHTRIPPHAAVSATVEQVRLGERPEAAGFVNAVLRRVAERDLTGWAAALAPALDDDPIGHLSFVTAHPRWITAALADALEADPAPTTPDVTDEPTVEPTVEPDPSADLPADLPTEVPAGLPTDLPTALQADDVAPRVHLVARPGRIDRDELLVQCRDTGLRAQPGRWSQYAVVLEGGDPARLPAVVAGTAAVQDEGSQLVAAALAAVPLDGPDAHWLDLAAGPGGKAALLGSLAALRGADVVAIEPIEHRADLVRRATAGLPVRVQVADGRATGLPAGSFDRVLLDAPCTGLGALRRRPEARWRRTPGDVADLVALQQQLLDAALELVRPGGVVGYVTCSPHLAETVEVVQAVTGTDGTDGPDGSAPDRPAVRLLDARAHLPGVTGLGDGPSVQLWPHRHGTDAMFLALLQRT
ncbi:RsmB/NOP family class I SAM-dependent RNA methyltransferase [Nakamurella leprariae]|uniref:RsmB/NOP family class I SAM-dependent RNA methyltransferase n=1 Tax=Nakamurella leprariae TaxID=2803911 RepID=A0A938Y8F4_9ACTN|nr:RsmB/NOP family class I SAM-dependent RNA methyltransferase [Nakamurella leprariae]MBM9467745.1 RsmB/NOP family class I SAM-dependent RNA methyltransferase [Nakamurella leprariae]